jgi:outer membrane murein-binding lipoprotein Lpp
MAAGTIISVLTRLPWGQVIDAAPKLAEGATKLWNSVARRKKTEDEGAAAPFQPDQASATPVEAIRAQVDSLQDSVDALKDEMQAATELIKALAEQNAALIQRVELNRVRLVRQTAALAVVSVGLVASVIYLFAMY